MPVSPLMLRFVEDELSRAPALAERTATATLTQLQQPAKPGAAVVAANRQVQQEVIEALRRGTTPFGLAFVDSLQALVMADVRGLDNTSAVGNTTIAGGLQLMDETRIEADIEISRAAQWIDSAAEWELRELQTFTSTLIGQTHVSAESNPLRPAVYAQALWDADRQIETDAVLLYRDALAHAQRVRDGESAALLHELLQAEAAHLHGIDRHLGEASRHD